MSKEYTETQSGMKLDGPYVIREGTWKVGLCQFNKGKDSAFIPVENLSDRMGLNEKPIPTTDNVPVVWNVGTFTGKLNSMYYARSDIVYGFDWVHDGKTCHITSNHQKFTVQEQWTQKRRVLEKRYATR